MSSFSEHTFSMKRLALMAGALLLFSVFIAFGYQVWIYYLQVRYQQAHPEEAFASLFTRSTFGVGSGPVILPSPDDDPSFGPANAPVQIIAFEEFECPFSQRFFSTVKAIEKDFPNEVRFVYRDFPLEDLHPQARLAAEASECADEQGAFWTFHDKLFLNPSALAVDDLKRTAQQLNLDVRAFTACLDQRTMKQEVQQDIADGIAAGVSGTPTLFINGKKIEGAIPYRYLKPILQKEIEAKQAEGL